MNRSEWLPVGRLILCAAMFTYPRSAPAQAPGKSIGSISTQGDLIVFSLDDGVLGKANPFDLGRTTLRFTRADSQYRAEKVAFEWDPEFGHELTGSDVKLTRFAFPFSGRNWEEMSVGQTGSIRF